MSEMNAMQRRQFRRVVGRHHARRADVQQLWLDCRHLADHERRRRPAKHTVSFLWTPYAGRVDGRSLVALYDLAAAIGGRLDAAKTADGFLFSLTRYGR